MFTELFMILSRTTDGQYVALPKVFTSEVQAEDDRAKLHSRHQAAIVKLVTPIAMTLYTPIDPHRNAPLKGTCPV